MQVGRNVGATISISLGQLTALSATSRIDSCLPRQPWQLQLYHMYIYPPSPSLSITAPTDIVFGV